MDILKKFLDSEINTQELYDDIISFITSFHIISGEFEGNRFIIKKIDRLNYFIFPEDEGKEGKPEISYVMSIFENTLLNEINNYAKNKGIIVKK